MKNISMNSQITYSRVNLLNEEKETKDVLISKLENIITSLFHNENCNFNLLSFYNKIFRISNENINKIQELLNITIINLMNVTSKKLEEYRSIFESNLDFKLFEEFIEIYTRSEFIVEKIKSLFINNKTRFNKEIILKINSVNVNNVFLDYLNNKENIILKNLKTFLLSNSLNKLTKENLIVIVKFLRKINANDILKEINYTQCSLVLDEVLKSSEVYFNKISINENNLDSITDYFNCYIEKINNIVINHNFIFCDNESRILNNTLNDKIIFHSIKIILNKKELYSILISKKNESLFHLIIKITNKYSDIFSAFKEDYFNTFYDNIMSKLPSPTGIKETLHYIEILLNGIKSLNDIFKLFNQDRRVQIKYKETLLKIINNKKVKNLPLVCAIYINELISRNFNNNLTNSNYSNLIDKINLLKIILQNIEDTETFIIAYQKFFIKRVSNFRFNYSNEMILIKMLKEVFSFNQLFSLYRTNDDIKSSEEFYKSTQIYNKENNLYLFSFNAINKNDLEEVIQNLPCKLINILNQINEIHKQRYPHRVVSFSQNLSTIVTSFNGREKCTLILNFIQFSILLSCVSKNFIKVEEIIYILKISSKYTNSFRANLISLINYGIIKVKNESSPLNLLNSDEITINIDFVIKDGKSLLNMTNLVSYDKLENQINPLNQSKANKDELTLTRDHTSQSDIYALENSMESHNLTFIQNKIYIIDSRITRIVKAKNNELIDHNSLIKLTLLESKLLFNENNMPDIPLINKRVESLIERGLIKRNIDENKITYSFS